MLFIMCGLGIAGHFLSKIWDCMTTKTAFNWRQHGLFALYSAVILTAVLLAGDSAGFLPPLTNFSAFLLGYFADSVTKNLSLFNPFKDPAA